MERLKQDGCNMPKRIDIDAEELANRIYDTLVGNVGVSKYHVALEPEHIDKCEVTADEGKMFFKIGRRTFKITVKEVNPRYFKTYEE